eukprot:TRINITY_DN70219_c0_g1_i1.p1 TRINITY_DN70219_c0_g1~~TRINITY_DN70219_c0_g1_i1.p1  ORF type:complete len:536 (+),score=218.52 TRINITY_DN70219_c0_g1_i1:88-1608(+)
MPWRVLHRAVRAALGRGASRPAAALAFGAAGAAAAAGFRDRCQQIAFAEELELNELTAVSAVDGRYWGTGGKLLAPYLSEFALMRYRVLVEVEYFIALLGVIPQLRGFPTSRVPELRRELIDNFSMEDCRWIKEKERETRHDVKAVEYFIKKSFDKFGLGEYMEWVHFGLTSNDVNTVAYSLMMKDAVNLVYIPRLEALIANLTRRIDNDFSCPMLAFTHGQPASPTNLAKEFKVFRERLEEQLRQLRAVPFQGKFGGATGNLNAHRVSFPDIDWLGFCDGFCAGLGLQRQQYTTQIEHYDNLGAVFDAVKRINTVLLDLSRDVWLYVAKDYFKQLVKKGEIGSSAMPHKVNPIDFENAEGNLGIANGTFEHLAQKLPVSRLQRDLSDSTVMRNIGVPLGHSLVALASLERGLGRLEVNREAIRADLDSQWAVVAEALNNILRREGWRGPQGEGPYEAIKELTRTGGHRKITQQDIHAWIDGLANVSAAVRQQMKSVTPFNYTGYT